MTQCSDADVGLFFVNARFRLQSMTGVQRYADEICQRLQSHLAEIVPPRSSGSGLRGHLWEQTALHRIARHQVLWSPCNSGPLRCGRHVVTIHDMAPFDVPEGYASSYRALYKALIPRLARRAVRVLTVSEFSKSRIVEIAKVDPDKIVVIPNGVSSVFQADNEDPASSPADDNDGNFILAVGSLSPRKNLVGLMTAWQNLYRAGRTRDVQLYIVGGEVPRVFGDQLICKPDRSGVHFLGRVDDRRLGQLYNRALCCVNPSFYEGFGIPIVEALAAGCPVICSDRTAFPEVGGDVVDYFDPGNTESMMDAIDIAINRYRVPATRKRQGEVSKMRATLFNWDRSAEQVRSVLNEVALDV